MSSIPQRAELEETLLAPLVKPGRGYRVIMAALALVVTWGIYAWSRQLQQGLVVTGMRDQVFWGLYIATFVFFVSISLTGTILSAALRITGYKWQIPITRLAEVITAAALLAAVAMIIVDMGRPERLLNVFIYGRLQSPLIWDVMAITTYLIGSLIYLYLPLMPDLALCRDKLGASVSPFRQRLYRLLSLGWQDTPTQRERLEKLMQVMTIVIIPVAVSVHSVTAWIYAMTYRPGWDTTILAPYFVVSAFASGIAMIIMVVTFYRRVFHLEKYITLEQYTRLGWLLLGLTLAYAYFSFAEILPGGYKLPGEERELLALLFTGPQAPAFWASILGGIVVPALLICNRGTRTVAGLTAAAILVTIAMWIKKSYLLVVPTLEVPLMPFYSLGQYNPTWIEWSITLGGVAGFMLLVVIFFHFFPAITIWELARPGEGPQARIQVGS